MAWLEKGDRKIPESYRSHAPQERLKIIFKVIAQKLDLAKSKSQIILTELNNCLTLCDKFDFVDQLSVPLAVTNLFTLFLSSNMSDHKEVNWQVIAVAFKLKVFARFIQCAQDLNG